METNPRLMALEAMAGDAGRAPAPAAIPPHDVECPNCGHQWVMGEDYKDED
jgi:hypothetical protein